MNFNKIVLISIIAQFCACSVALCQPSAISTDEVEKVKAELDAQYESWAEERRKDYSPQWDEQIQGFNAEATALIFEHDRLLHEQEMLTQELNGLQKALAQQKEANRTIESDIAAKKILMEDKHIKERAAAEIYAAEKALEGKKKELDNLDRELATIEQKIKLGQLKLTAIGADTSSIDQKLSDQETIERLTTQVSEAEEREHTLAVELERLQGLGPLDPSVAVLKEEIDGLNAKIAESQMNALKPAPKPAIDVKALVQKKRELLKEITQFSDEIKNIEKAQTMGVADPRIKALVEEMSGIDLRNNQLKEQIETLNENIAILQSHVKKLEYHADAIKALKGNIDSIEPFQ